MAGKKKDITGQTFGSLTAIAFDHMGSNHMSFWQYRCKCGNLHIARANTIAHQSKKGDPEIPSCGCVELARKTRHGFRKAKDTHPAYRAYRGMMSRCYDTNCPEYGWYGAKGVTVCDEWKENPEAFVRWSLENGWAKGLHIDKDILSEAKGIHPHIYSPETCQWVDARKNVGFATNRSNYGKHPNVKLSQEQVDEILAAYKSGHAKGPELARHYGVDHSTIYRLIKLAEGAV